MTDTPNLDAIAKLGPFLGRSVIGDNCYVVDCDGHVLEPEEIEAALNEWVGLRAYRERTEAALQAWCDDLTAFLDEPDGEAMHLFTRSEIEDLKESGLWREPAPKEAE